MRKSLETMPVIWGMTILGLMAMIAGCSPAPKSDEKPAVAAIATPALTDAQKADILKGLPSPYTSADLLNGQKQFNKCRSCHTLYEGEMALIGPNLYTVFGRKSGTYPGYHFSEAMKTHNVVWDFDTLNTYLAAPQESVPGTKMGFMGIKSDTDRRDLIAYLRVETSKAP